MANEKGIASPFGLRVPPQDVDAEKALLGSILIRPQALLDISDVIRAESFYSIKHQHIFRVMQDLYGKGEAIDLLTVSSRLKEIKQLDQLGGSSYLAELSNFVPSASNIRHYADIVHKKNALRDLISAAEYISELGYTEQDDLSSLFDRVGKRVLDVTTYAKKKFVNIKDTLHEAWERLDRLHKSKDELRGVPTGFKELDNKLAGLQKSDLIILAARPSMGKTTLALDIARNTALNHKTPVGIFSLEMSSHQLVDRMLAAEARVDSWKLRTGKLSTDEEFGLIRDAMDRLSQAPIFIDDDPNNNIMSIRSSARRMKAEYGLELIIIDYLQLMVPRQSNASLVEQVTEISRSLKGLARELDIPVLALSQLNRNVETRGGRPKLSDLRDSGSIEQDADVVMFIHREGKDNNEPGKSNNTEILIEKHRNGPTGKADLYFDDKHLLFTSLDKTDFGSF
ncbi:MAG TPA: replicative DNA helicase [Candidatus Paceibacterota bacterium]